MTEIGGEQNFPNIPNRPFPPPFVMAGRHVSVLRLRGESSCGSVRVHLDAAVPADDGGSLLPLGGAIS